MVHVPEDIKPLLRPVVGHRVGRFLVGGASTTLVSYAAYLVLLRWTPYLVAYGIAFVLGIVWSYGVNTLFVFRAKPSVARALAFPLVYLAQWVAGSIILAALVDGLHLPAALGPLVVIVATLPLTYAMSKWVLTARGVGVNSIPPATASDASPTEPVRVVDGCIAAVLATALAWFVYAPVDMRVPIVSVGDSASAQYLMKTIAEHGTYLRNPDVGAPFGATMYDYPVPEPTHQIVIRTLGLFTHDAGLLFNLFYFLTFATSAGAAWWALRKMGVERACAMAGAIAFALLPYHFLRNHHVFLASYAAIPIFCRYAVQLGAFRATHLEDAPRASWGTVALLAVAAGSGIYYAWFGLLFLTFAAMLGAARSRSTVPLRIGAIYAATVIAVVTASLVPNIMFRIAHGSDPLIAARLGWESEYYGLRITQLLFPTIGHRIETWHAAMVAYNNSAVKASENFTAALGIIGSLGFVAGVAYFFLGERRMRPSRWTAGALAAMAVLYATIGGFGAVVAWLALPEIRGLNRISVFIAFLSLFVALEWIGSRMRSPPRLRWLAAIAIVAVAYFDQVPVRSLRHEDPQAFARQQAFYERVQAELPPGSSVFELPYTYFPESPRASGSYLLIEPYLRTHGLRWSFGDMHGRPSDAWYERAANLQGEDFTDALATAGFSAVYVDRRACEDRCASLEASLRAQLGAPILEDVQLARALYRVAPARPDARPLVIASNDRGWHRPEGATASTTWSRGSARLAIGNPTSAPVAVRIGFKLASLSARKVEFSYGTRKLDERVLVPNIDSDVSFTFSADPGISYLDLNTDEASSRPGNGDPRYLAFKLGELVVTTP